MIHWRWCDHATITTFVVKSKVLLVLMLFKDRLYSHNKWSFCTHKTELQFNVNTLEIIWFNLRDRWSFDFFDPICKLDNVSSWAHCAIYTCDDASRNWTVWIRNVVGMWWLCKKKKEISWCHDPGIDNCDHNCMNLHKVINALGSRARNWRWIKEWEVKAQRQRTEV